VQRRPALKKISTTKVKNQAAKKKVTIGMDLGDRSSRYCLLDEEGVVIGEPNNEVGDKQKMINSTG
jgi:activator of 2-hydroxyglutaryl-CoA dehydratase